MNRKPFLPMMAGIGLLAVVGCHSGSGSTGNYVTAKPPALKNAIAQPGQEASYFPFTVGNQWTFESDTSVAVNGQVSQTQKKDVTYQLKKLTPSANGGQDAFFEVLTDGTLSSDEVWRLDKTGIYQVSSGPPNKQKVLNPPQPVVLFPVKPMQTFKWSAKVPGEKGAVLESSIDGKVNGQEEIDTDMGPFNALAVECTGTVKGANVSADVTSTIWLIPDVGIGRFRLTSSTLLTSPDPKLKGKSMRRDSVQVMKLKNYSLKK